MSEPQILAAAALWAAGHDTVDIGRLVGVAESEVANRLELIRAARKALRARP